MESFKGLRLLVLFGAAGTLV